MRMGSQLCFSLRLFLQRLELLLLLGLLFGDLLLARNVGLCADTAKHEADAEDLHAREAVTKGHHGQNHGEHLTRHRDRDEENRRECGEGINCSE